MTYPRLLALVTFLLFALIIVLFLMKGDKTPASKPAVVQSVALKPVQSNPAPTQSIVIELGQRVQEVKQAPNVNVDNDSSSKAIADAVLLTQPVIEETPKIKSATEPKTPAATQEIAEVLPDANRIEMLFNRYDPRLPFVETISYKSHVPWHKGRPAWLSDYASYYNTSRHFIARSLNGRVDYVKQDLAEGDRFNVFRKDKNISFYLLVDLTLSKLWFYAIDEDTHERFLLKTYPVGLGRTDSQRASGLLTPLGKYTLGSKIAIYKPQTQGYYNGKKVEMLRIFGTRWIPFEKEISGCTAPAKGLGIHGVPWNSNSNGTLAEDQSCLGKYESDGCVRLCTADIEEIFAIVITKPTIIELVANFRDAVLPGTEDAERKLK